MYLVFTERDLRLREVKQLDQEHTAIKWQSWVQAQACLTLKSVLFPPMMYVLRGDVDIPGTFLTPCFWKAL